MNVEEVRGLSDEEIRREIESQHEEWRNLRFQNALGRLTTFHQLREVRKSIARLHTVLRERAIEREPAAHYAANDRVRARRRAEKQAKKITTRRHLRFQARRRSRIGR